MLVPGMDRLHPDLGHGTPVSDLRAAVEALSADVADLTDDQLLVGLLHVVALVSAKGCDAHTGAFVWGTGTYPVDSLPLRLWLFGDDVVIVDALAPYDGLVGLRIETIGDNPIAGVVAALDPIIPRDNAQTVRLLTPRYLLIPQVLRGLGVVAPGQRAVSLGLVSGDGDRTTEDVVPISMADYNAWAGPYGLHLPANPSVEYLSRIDDALWWRVQPTARRCWCSTTAWIICRSPRPATCGRPSMDPTSLGSCSTFGTTTGARCRPSTRCWTCSRTLRSTSPVGCT